MILYTGGLNAQYVVSYIDGITELEKFDMFVGGAKHYINVDDVLNLSVEIIDKMGYFKSTDFGICTRDLVKIAIYEQKSGTKYMVSTINYELEKNKYYDVSFNTKDFYKDDTEEKVKAIKEYYLSLENDSEFINNVQVLLKEGYTTSKNIGFLAFLPEGYNRYLKKESKKTDRENKLQLSEHFGEISKRYRDIEVSSMSKITSWCSDYGETYLYMIVLKNDNILIWKSSNWYSKEDMESVSKIDFTVKAHKEYKGIKQTDVTRCKVFIQEHKESDCSVCSVDEALDYFYKLMEA